MFSIVWEENDTPVCSTQCSLSRGVWKKNKKRWNSSFSALIYKGISLFSSMLSHRHYWLFTMAFQELRCLVAILPLSVLQIMSVMISGCLHICCFYFILYFYVGCNVTFWSQFNSFHDMGFTIHFDSQNIFFNKIWMKKKFGLKKLFFYFWIINNVHLCL